MDETDFYEAVRQRAPLDSTDAAREATAATLRTLGERLSDGEVADLAARLPDALADPLEEAAGGGAADFPFEEFVRRVGERLDVGGTEALRLARAVGTALVETVGEDEFHDFRAQLPEEYDRLFWGVETAEFLAATRRRAALDSTDAARETATAVLAVLGERLSPGEAAAVAAYLPAEFAETVTASEAPATDYSADEFVERVTDRGGVPADDAGRHVQAVFAVLADVLPPREFDDVLEQLPDEYGPLLRVPEEGA